MSRSNRASPRCLVLFACLVCACNKPPEELKPPASAVAPAQPPAVAVAPAPAPAPEPAVPEKPAPIDTVAVPVPAPSRVPPPARARAPAPVSKSAPAPASTAATLDGYKREAAQHIHSGNAADIFAGAPPAVLKSVVVLSISVDAGGEVRNVRVHRSNGYLELEQRAMRSVSRVTPLPRPDRAVMRAAAAGYLETWLFRDDGKFQIRSVAMEQEKGPE